MLLEPLVLSILILKKDDALDQKVFFIKSCIAQETEVAKTVTVRQ